MGNILSIYKEEVSIVEMLLELSSQTVYVHLP